MEESIFEEMRQDVKALLNRQSEIAGKVSSIETQTIKTNGRVGELEKRNIDLRVWQASMMGGLAVLSVIVTGLIIPLAVNFFQNHVKL